jgi:hypothetical protein
MAFIIGWVSEREAEELKKRGWGLEEPPEELKHCNNSPEFRYVMVYVNTDLFQIMNGPDWEGHDPDWESMKGLCKVPKEDKMSEEALNATILRWRGLLKIAKEAKGKEVFVLELYKFRLGRRYILLGTQVCPLCKEFYSSYCQGCPIYTRTHQHGCTLTPYYKVISSLRDCSVVTDDLIDAIQEEVEFLESLTTKERNTNAGNNSREST